MPGTRQQARLLEASNQAARYAWADLLERRSYQVGLAKGLLQDVLSAASAPEDVRDQCIRFAVARIQRELVGRLAE